MSPRRARRIGRAGNGDAAIGFLERRGVVHPISRHADDVAALLQDIHDVEFVFREHLGEAVRLFDGLRRLRRLVMLDIAKCAGIEDVRAHPQLPGGFLSDRHLIAGNHLDADTHLTGARDRGFGIGARLVEQRQHADHPPLVFLIGAGDS